MSTVPPIFRYVCKSVSSIILNWRVIKNAFLWEKRGHTWSVKCRI